MRKTAIWAVFIVVCGSIGLAQGGRGQGGERPTVILEKAP